MIFISKLLLKMNRSKKCIANRCHMEKREIIRMAQEIIMLLRESKLRLVWLMLIVEDPHHWYLQEDQLLR